MAKEGKNRTITIEGLTWLRKAPYTVNINVADGKISTITVKGGPANLHVQELCKKIEVKHPECVEECVQAIKLKMDARYELKKDF